LLDLGGIVHARADLSLHDSEVRFLKRIASSFTIITDYMASKAPWKARTEILDPRNWGGFLSHRRDLM